VVGLAAWLCLGALVAAGAAGRLLWQRRLRLQRRRAARSELEAGESMQQEMRQLLPAGELYYGNGGGGGEGGGNAGLHSLPGWSGEGAELCDVDRHQRLCALLHSEMGGGGIIPMRPLDVLVHQLQPAGAAPVDGLLPVGSDGSTAGRDSGGAASASPPASWQRLLSTASLQLKPEQLQVGRVCWWRASCSAVVPELPLLAALWRAEG